MVEILIFIAVMVPVCMVVDRYINGPWKFRRRLRG